MNKDNPSQSSEGQTTVLHMNKFVPKGPAEPPTNTTTEDSPTIVIRRAAAKVVAQTPEPVVVPKGAGNALPPKEMLGAVAYAYAKGVYRSEDIERKLVTDPAMRAALGDEVPDAKTIRNFRRLNRGAILDTLESFFGWIRKKRPAAAPAPGPARLATGTSPAAPEEATAIHAKRAAVSRLDEAAFVDNMSKDD